MKYIYTANFALKQHNKQPCNMIRSRMEGFGALNNIDYSQLSLRWTLLGLALTVHLKEISILKRVK